MAMGTMGGAASGSESSKAMNLLELLADPVKSKAKLEDYDRRTKAAQDAEASSRAAKTEADQTIEHARQASEALRNQHVELDRRASDVSNREAAVKAREDAVTNAERAQVQGKQAWEQEQKRREGDLAKRTADAQGTLDVHKKEFEAAAVKSIDDIKQREDAIVDKEHVVVNAVAEANRRLADADQIKQQHQAKLAELNKRIAALSQDFPA